MNGLKVGYTANVQKLRQVHSLERAGAAALVRSAAVHVHGTVFFRTTQLSGVPLAQRHRLRGSYDGRTGPDVEPEFGYAVVEAEREEVAAAAGLLTVVQYHTVALFGFEVYLHVEFQVSVQQGRERQVAVAAAERGHDTGDHEHNGHVYPDHVVAGRTQVQTGAFFCHVVHGQVSLESQQCVII